MGEKNEKEEGKKEVGERGSFSSKITFILSLIGYSVGFGNIWRFPYIVYRNGEGTFMLAYIICVFLVGMPMYNMELCLGQFSREGPPGCFKIAPVLIGLGISIIFVISILCVYYNVLMSYALFFIYNNFTKTLPWTHCSNSWNTVNCFDGLNRLPNALQNSSLVSNATTSLVASTVNNISRVFVNVSDRTTPSEEFFQFRVLQKFPEFGINNLGALRVELVIALAVSWIFIYLVLFKGLVILEKAIYLTGTLPYLILAVLMLRGVTLPGSKEALIHLLHPTGQSSSGFRGDSRHFQIWIEACSQLFYSLSIAMGGIITYASFNPFNNNCFKDAIIVIFMDTFTSFLSTVVIFSFMGHMSYKSGVMVQDVISQGPGLVFKVYPQALSFLPFEQMWTFILFFALYLLGFNCTCALIQTLINSLHDGLTAWFPYKQKPKIMAGLCFIMFICALPFLTQAGIDVLDFTDGIISKICLIWIAVMELVGVMWIYGFRKFISDCEFMIGHKIFPKVYWIAGWAFIAPITLIGLALYSLKRQIKSLSGINIYAKSAAILIMLICFGAIVITATYQFLKAQGSFSQRWFEVTNHSKSFWLRYAEVWDNYQHQYKLKPLEEKPNKMAMGDMNKDNLNDSNNNINNLNSFRV